MKFFCASSRIGILLMYAHILLADPIIKDNNLSTITTTTTTPTGAFSDCLHTDSISCLQLTLYRKAKSIFENPQIEIFGGVSLLKENEGRQGKAIDENALAVETAPTVETRTVEISNYLMNGMKDFVAERSLNLNFANMGRSVARAIPDDIKADLRELVVESRTKKKKIIKKLLPILMGVGAKVAVLSVGALVGLLFVAKKALVVSVLAFIMALIAGAGSGLGFGSGGGGLLGGLGGLFGGKNSASSAGWSSGTGGWSSAANSGWDSHGAYSSPVGQSLAYSGYKSRR